MISTSIHGFDVLRLSLALLPVILFLIALRGLDSYKLVSICTVILAMAAGASESAMNSRSISLELLSTPKCHPLPAYCRNYTWPPISAVLPSDHC